MKGGREQGGEGGRTRRERKQMEGKAIEKERREIVGKKERRGWREERKQGRRERDSLLQRT